MGEGQDEKSAAQKFEEMLGALLSVPKKALDDGLSALKPDEKTSPINDLEPEEDATP